MRQLFLYLTILVGFSQCVDSETKTQQEAKRKVFLKEIALDKTIKKYIGFHGEDVFVQFVSGEPYAVIFFSPNRKKFRYLSLIYKSPNGKVSYYYDEDSEGKSVMREVTPDKNYPN